MLLIAPLSKGMVIALHAGRTAAMNGEAAEQPLPHQRNANKLIVATHRVVEWGKPS